MHLTDEQLNEYLDHETDDRASIELHLSSCVDCAARLSALQDLFAELGSLPEVELPRPLAARFVSSRSLPARLPRSLTLTVTLQAALAVVAVIVAAPFVMQFIAPYVSSLPAPSLADVFIQLQTQWTFWLDTVSQIHMPSIPEIPVVRLSNLFSIFTVIGVSLLWLIGNGLLLRNQIK
jgi:hypothetical protein